MLSIESSNSHLATMRAPSSVIALNKTLMRQRIGIEAARQELWALRKEWLSLWAKVTHEASVDSRSIVRSRLWTPGSREANPTSLDLTAADRATLSEFNGWLSDLCIVEVEDPYILHYGNAVKRSYVGPIIAARLEQPLSNHFNTRVSFAAVSLPATSLANQQPTDFHLIRC